MPDQYRVVDDHLYELVVDEWGGEQYVHCYSNPFSRSEYELIKDYEESFFNS